MKKLSLEMLRLTSDEVLGRSQMKKITGGQSWICTCGDNPPITVWDSVNPDPDNYSDPTQICTIVYGLPGGQCSEANP